MISYRDIAAGLAHLGLNRSTPVLAHVATSRLGEIRGGTDTLLGALLATVDNVMVPCFTYSTMIVPEKGPEDNFLDYGSGRQSNFNAVVFNPDLPADMPDHEFSETLRKYPDTNRSGHPILSFAGLGLDIALIDQSGDDPYAPVRKMRELKSWVVLIGAEPSSNFSLHYAEFLAGRKQFVRWALTGNGILECPHFPGCSDGFQKIHFYLQDELRVTTVAESTWYAMPMDALIDSAVALIKDDPFALLCNSISCPRCNLVRKTIKSQIANHWQSEEDEK
jgi:aminoglycoside 3-N-acetyltransferase